MERLHRLHGGFITGAAVVRALRGMAFVLLLVAGAIWVINRSFSTRPATVLIVCVVIWGLRSMLRTLGELLGPPEPFVKSGTRLETRRALRRAGLVRRRWR
jgi:hypothetical protein